MIDFTKSGTVAVSTFPDGASSIAHKFTTTTPYVTAGALLADFQNNEVSKASIDINGKVLCLSVILKSGGGGSITFADGTVQSTAASSSGGNVTGTGANTQLTFWTGTSSISGDANILVDSTSHRIGIGSTVAPAYDIDLRSNTNHTQFHIRSNSTADDGGFLLSEAPSELFASGGAAWNGTQWIAKATQASIWNCGFDGALRWFSDTGLTIGNAFTPTQRMLLNATGLAIGDNASPANKLSVTGKINSTLGIDAGGNVTSTADFISTVAVNNNAFQYSGFWQLGAVANFVQYFSQIPDGSTAIAHKFVSSTTYATAGSLLAAFTNNATTNLGVDFNGQLTWRANQYTNNSGTPGNTTINKVTGRAAIPNTANNIVVTNSQVATTSIIVPVLETTNAGIANIVITPGAGSFTATAVNGTGVPTTPSAAVTFSFIVFNS